MDFALTEDQQALRESEHRIAQRALLVGQHEVHQDLSWPIALSCW